MSTKRRPPSYIKENQRSPELLGSPFYGDRTSNYSYSPSPDVKLNHSPRLSLHSPRVSRYPLYREQEEDQERLPSPTLDFVDSTTNTTTAPNNHNLSNENSSLEDKESQDTEDSLFLSQPSSSLSIPPIPSIDDDLESEPVTPKYISTLNPNQSYRTSPSSNYHGSKQITQTPSTFYRKSFSSPNSSERSISDESFHSIQESFKSVNEIITSSPHRSPTSQIITPKLISQPVQSPKTITPSQQQQLPLTSTVSYSPSLSITPSNNGSILTKVSTSNTPTKEKNGIKNRLKRLSVHLSSSSLQSLVRINSNTSPSQNTSSLSRKNSFSSLRRNNSVTSLQTTINDIPKTSYYETPKFDIDGYNNHNYSLSPQDNNSNPSVRFWKYHIFKYGKEFYITTNPTIKHAYCLQGPSYFTETTWPDTYKKPTAKGGFTLTFRSLEDIGTNKAPRMVITKRDEREGGHYTVSIPLLSKVSINSSSPHKKSPPVGPSIFNGMALPKQVHDNEIVNQDPQFKNYELKDISNQRWNIGSIPKIDKYNSHADKFVYFHQNYIEKSPYNNNGHMGKSPNSRSKIPPVIAVFRPNRRRINIINSVTKAKLKSKIEGLIQQQQYIHSLINEQSSDVHNTNYYSCEDGLYNRKNPTDDQPDDSKLGWITIYEDNELLKSGDQRKDSFDLVLGLLLAVAYENSLS